MEHRLPARIDEDGGQDADIVGPSRGADGQVGTYQVETLLTFGEGGESPHFAYL